MSMPSSPEIADTSSPLGEHKGIRIISPQALLAEMLRP